MADPTELGSRIKAIREDRGLSREFVAGKLGCHKTNLAHIEANRQQPSVEQFRIMARLFDCSMDELLEGPLPRLGSSASDEREPHPRTGDVTRLEWCPQCGQRMGPHRAPCAGCGYRRDGVKSEAA